MGIPSLKSWHFEASEDIMTKFKSQGLHIIRIKYLNANGSGSTPFLYSRPLEHRQKYTGILLHKQAKRRTIMNTTVCKNLSRTGCGGFVSLLDLNFGES